MVVQSVVLLTDHDTFDSRVQALHAGIARHAPQFNAPSHRVAFDLRRGVRGEIGKNQMDFHAPYVDGASLPTGVALERGTM